MESILPDIMKYGVGGLLIVILLFRLQQLTKLLDAERSAHIADMKECTAQRMAEAMKVADAIARLDRIKQGG